MANSTRHPNILCDVWYEAIVNACAHRSYNLKTMTVFVKMFDSKLVIESPGGFPGYVNPSNIYELGSCPRNPYLMEAMYYLDFVRAANEGTRRMKALMEQQGLPLPEFEQKEIQGAVVRVTLRNNIALRRVWVDKDASALVGKALWDKLNDNERRVINFISEHGKINVSQTQRLAGKGWVGSKKMLDCLVSKQILDSVHHPKIVRDSKAHYKLATRKDGP